MSTKETVDRVLAGGLLSLATLLLCMCFYGAFLRTPPAPSENRILLWDAGGHKYVMLYRGQRYYSSSKSVWRDEAGVALDQHHMFDPSNADLSAEWIRLESEENGRALVRECQRRITWAKGK